MYLRYYIKYWLFQDLLFFYFLFATLSEELLGGFQTLVWREMHFEDISWCFEKPKQVRRSTRDRLMSIFFSVVWHFKDLTLVAAPSIINH